MPEKSLSYLTFNPSQVTPAIKSLFLPSDPASVRCFAVLAGQAAGKIFTDNPEDPSWAVLQEAAFGSIYMAGLLQPAMLQQLVANLRMEGDVLVGLWSEDPRWSLLPPGPDYSGHTIEFADHTLDQPPMKVPAGCKLVRLNHSLSKQITGRNLLIHMYGSIQLALDWGYGLCLLREDELLCEAFAGPCANSVIEIGVETQPHHMHKGYATITCSQLIHQMEHLGFNTYWNCASANQASIALARKLGYQTQKEYRLLAWFKPESQPSSSN